jgi:hypothetical protein
MLLQIKIDYLAEIIINICIIGDIVIDPSGSCSIVIGGVDSQA